MNQAIQDANAIDQSAGIPATGRGVPKSMQQYFSGTNPGAYGSGDWRSNMNQSYNWPDSGARYEYNRPYNMSDVAGQVGEYGQVPGQGNNEMMYQAPKKNIFSRFTTPLMQILQSQRNNPEEVFGLKNFPTREGRVNYHPNDSLYAGMNVATGFGKGLSGAGEKRIGRIEDTIAGIKGGKWSQLEEDDPSAYAAKLRFHEEKLKRFKAEQAAYQADLAAQTGQGGTTIVPPDTGGKTTYSGPATTDWKPSGSYGAAQGTKGSWTPGGTITAPSASGGYQQKQGSHHYKVGGRIGYQGGELVDEDINIQGPDFDVNENMEMAEGPSPFEMRIQELVDEGLSWQEAYTIAAEEFGMAEGQEDSFSEEGIASLV